MEEKIYNVPPEWTRRAYLDEAGYTAKYEASIRNPESFWGEEGKRIHWYKPYTRVKNTNFGPGDVSIRLIALSKSFWLTTAMPPVSSARTRRLSCVFLM